MAQSNLAVEFDFTFPAKPARLTEDEFLKMKAHPSLTAEILTDFKYFQDIATYAKHHHERYDGRGYPDGLAGEDIPLYSRIILIADTFDAMTSKFLNSEMSGISFQSSISPITLVDNEIKNPHNTAEIKKLTILDTRDNFLLLNSIIFLFKF